MTRPFVLLPILPLLSSCALVQAPLRLAGGAIEGTARATRAAATAPGRAYEKHQKKKEKDRRQQEAKDRVARGSGGNLGGESTGFGSSPSFGDSSSFGSGVPLDGEAPVIPDPPENPGRATTNPPATGTDPPLPDFGN